MPKIRYARLVVEALDPSRVPTPLDGVLAYISDSHDDPLQDR